MSKMFLLISLLCFLSFGSQAHGQWLQQRTANVPRTSDGRPDFGAVAPQLGSVPDFSGMWQAAPRLPCDDKGLVCTDLPITAEFRNFGAGLADGLPYSEWGRETEQRRQGKEDPYVRCLTPGGPRMHVLPTMKKIVQTPALMLILNEYNTSSRQIHLDGRALPVDPNPTWNGYSSGRWDRDTLVVQSNGYRDDQWLDGAGSPLTSVAVVTERFRRPRFGTLEISITVEDLKAYTRPWTVTLMQELVVDTDFLDLMCLENEKDIQYLP